MTAKEYLAQVYQTQTAIDIKLERIARLQSLAVRTTAAIKKVPMGSRSAVSRVEEAVTELHEQTDALAAEVKKMTELNAQVAEAISKVADASERHLLEYRYLCFLSWEHIRGVMKLSERGCYRLHDRALRSFGSQWQSLAVNGSEWQ